MGDIDSIKDNKIHSSDLYREIKQASFETFKIANKFRKVGKCAIRFAEELINVPSIILTIFKISGTFKIVKGFLAIKKFNSSYKKAYKQDNLFSTFFEVFRITKAIKYMFDGAEAAIKFLTDYKMISSNAGALFKRVGRVFFPLTFIDCAVTTVRYIQTLRYLKEFKEKTALPKNGESIEKMQEACRFLLKERVKLKTIKVITKDCPLKTRIKNIMDRLASSIEIDRQKAYEEGKWMIGKLKDRLSSRAFAQTMHTALTWVNLTAVIMALACPILTLPVVSIELGSALVKIGNFYVERSLPVGDISHEESHSFYAIPLRSLIV